MITPAPEPELEAAVRRLQESYETYRASMFHVLRFGDVSISTLLQALNNKHASPIAETLGVALQLKVPTAEQAIPRLLDWLPVGGGMYPVVLNALIGAGELCAPFLIQRLKDAAVANDDAAIQNFLDLGCRLPSSVLPVIVLEVIELLHHQNPHIRENAADGIGRIGLPFGLRAHSVLCELAEQDAELSVRESAKEALARLGYER